MTRARLHIAALISVAGAAGAAACGGGSAGPVVDLSAMAAIPARLEVPEEAYDAADTLPYTGIEVGTMWTLDRLPEARWDSLYGFTPSSAWLEHIRTATLRFGDFCTASFASPSGLASTNYDCVRPCLEAVTLDGEDLLGSGFLAGTTAEERRCPGGQLDQLVKSTDVTERLLGSGATRSLDPRERSEALSVLTDEMVETCQRETRRICRVVPLYEGSRWLLDEYERFGDVRLVFAPERAVATPGGSVASYTWPRHALSAAFVRAYGADGRPAYSPHYFQWNPDGAATGDAVFVAGHPGSTSRRITLSEFMYERGVRHPLLLEFFEQRLAVFENASSEDPGVTRTIENARFSLENNLKLFGAELHSLMLPDIIAGKLRWEQAFRERINADVARAAAHGDVWDRMGEVQVQKARLFPELVISDPNNLFASEHLQLAAALVAWTRQMALPEAERSLPFQAAAAGSMRRRIEEPGRLDGGRSAALLAGRLEIASRWLDTAHPLRRAVRPDETFLQAARRIIVESRVNDPTFRRDALDLTPDGLASLEDPLLHLAGAMVRIHERVGGTWNEVLARELAVALRLAEARYAAFGESVAPDGTLTLRVSDGVVRGYGAEDARRGVRTRLDGLRTAADPLPDAWTEAWPSIDGTTPLDFVSTNDATGGNSGSPVLDRDGRLVGILFDGNDGAFASEFLFGTADARAVSVHVAAMLEALRSVYHADELLAELASASGRTE